MLYLPATVSPNGIIPSGTLTPSPTERSFSAIIAFINSMPRGQRTWHDLQVVQSQKVRLFRTSSRRPKSTIRHSWRGE